MSVYDIAFGLKRSQTTTKQYRLEWGEIVERLRNVTRTGETMKQYAEMSKTQRVDVKDVGFSSVACAQKESNLPSVARNRHRRSG